MKIKQQNQSVTGRMVSLPIYQFDGGTRFTCLAAVSRLEVGSEVARTRSRRQQVVIWNTYAASVSARALRMHQTKHVDVAAEMAVVA